MYLSRKKLHKPPTRHIKNKTSAFAAILTTKASFKQYFTDS